MYSFIPVYIYTHTHSSLIRFGDPTEEEPFFSSFRPLSSTLIATLYLHPIRITTAPPLKSTLNRGAASS